MKNKVNIILILRFTAIALCFAMLLFVVACNSERTDSNVVKEAVVLNAEDIDFLSADQSLLMKDAGINAVNDTSIEKTMTVVVFTVNMYKGNKISESSVSLKEISVSELPIDPVTSLEDVVGKYVLEDAPKGSCVSASNLSVTDPLINVTGLGEDYIMISEILLQYPDHKDVYEAIQKTIDENPGKTIYFPDGKYNIGKTIVIPSEEGKSVSLRLSNYATFGPTSDWDSNCTALIQYGNSENTKTQPADHSDYIMGGTFDCSGRLTAIEINGGGRLFVNNIAIENAKIGIHLKPNAAYNNLEDINITGESENGTKGLFVEGTNNSLINMRIYKVLRGVHLTGGDNVLINLHPLFSGRNSSSAIGFHDESTGNRYNICYSDQFMIGFKMSSHTRSHYDTCYAYWWTSVSYMIGFLCEGEFNSVITDSFINFEKGSSASCHYIQFVKQSTQGSGSSSGSRPSTSFDFSEPKGNGKIVNATVLPTRNDYSETKYYQQFEYNYN